MPFHCGGGYGINFVLAHGSDGDFGVSGCGHGGGEGCYTTFALYHCVSGCVHGDWEGCYTTFALSHCVYSGGGMYTI